MFKKVKRFAVIGAGNGGQAMAAYLALQGYEVNLYNRNQQRIKEIEQAGGIYLEGVFKGFGRLRTVTTNLEEALEGAEVLLVVTPATAHKSLAEKMSFFLVDGQMIVLNPGRTGGALEFSNTLQENGCTADVLISEAQTFLYASRALGKACAKIYGVKNKVAVAAFPSIKTRDLIERLIPVFPQFTPVENVLKTSLDNIGAVFHPAPTLLNMAWIESTEGQFTYYKEGITPSIARILEKIDQERIEVCSALGIEPTSAADWLRMSYGARGRNLYELLQDNKQYLGIYAPNNIQHRYIFEDVPMSLVPIASLGKMLEVTTPTINMIIDFANLVHNTDYRVMGRTAESLGLSDFSVAEIKHLVNMGSPTRPEIITNLRRRIFERVDNLVLSNMGDKLRTEGSVDS